MLIVLPKDEVQAEDANMLLKSVNIVVPHSLFLFGVSDKAGEHSALDYVRINTRQL